MSADLLAFLRARLDEDEAVVRAATAGPWRHDPTKHHRLPGTAQFEEAVFAGPPGSAATCIAATGETGDAQSMADAAYIARHDPVRARAEAEAKRAIVDRYAWLHEHGDTGGAAWVLPLLALPYSSHPDYDESWRP
jgi:hypothetical protein